MVGGGVIHWVLEIMLPHAVSVKWPHLGGANDGGPTWGCATPVSCCMSDLLAYMGFCFLIGYSTDRFIEYLSL